VILDGEIVALDEHGHPRFEWLLNRGKQGVLVYYV
jgi:ATP-dependent DNA ligase